MKINFLIPTTGVTGGVKVIFEYANGLVNRGHQVSLIYPFVLPLQPTFKDISLGLIKRLRRLILSFFGQDKIKSFPLDSRVKVIRLYNLASKLVPNADVCVATANETADWLVGYPDNKGKKFYFIQDYEVWSRDVLEVDATWLMPLHQIVIAPRLQDLAENKFNLPRPDLILNGIDLQVFYNRQPKTYTSKINVLLMYHQLPKKGFTDGLAAFKLAKQKYPDLQLSVFGACKPPQQLIPGVTFYYRPSLEKLREIYCSADIFLWPSRVEGFGLPPMEAMACRCAVISTDTGAIREYGVDGLTTIIVPPNDINKMSEALLRLANNRTMMRQLSDQAYIKIQEFSWDKSVDKLEAIISQ